MTAAQFARWRKRAKLTQEEVAEALGVTKGAVSHWETGREAISARTLAALRMLSASRNLPQP